MAVPWRLLLERRASAMTHKRHHKHHKHHHHHRQPAASQRSTWQLWPRHPLHTLLIVVLIIPLFLAFGTPLLYRLHLIDPEPALILRFLGCLGTLLEIGGALVLRALLLSSNSTDPATVRRRRLGMSLVVVATICAFVWGVPILVMALLPDVFDRLNPLQVGGGPFLLAFIALIVLALGGFIWGGLLLNSLEPAPSIDQQHAQPSISRKLATRRKLASQDSPHRGESNAHPLTD
jgi:hypothetical protein